MVGEFQHRGPQIPWILCRIFFSYGDMFKTLFMVTVPKQNNVTITQPTSALLHLRLMWQGRNLKKIKTLWLCQYSVTLSRAFLSLKILEWCGRISMFRNIMLPPSSGWSDKKEAKYNPQKYLHSAIWLHGITTQKLLEYLLPWNLHSRSCILLFLITQRFVHNKYLTLGEQLLEHSVYFQIFRITIFVYIYIFRWLSNSEAYLYCC